MTFISSRYSDQLLTHTRKFPAPVCIADAMPSDKLEKKRKRASDPHERPSKKAALELQALPPLAASLVEDTSELAPVIGERQ